MASTEISNPQQENVAYRFTPTQDWFSSNINSWTPLFPLIQTHTPRLLEIGSWEGRSAVFLLTELCKNGGEIVCIDHFDLMGTPAGRERYTKITHNLSLTGGKFRVLAEFSIPALMTLLKEEISSTSPGYDWIYVDGSHEADDTFLDGELVWRLAKKGAIIVFDDYHWDREPQDSLHHPRRGIDAFMTLHHGEYEQLSSPSQYQMILRKTSDMRIGFLVKDVIDDVQISTHDAFGYGINLALAIDSNYAMPAAVAIRSAVEQTPGRITVYIVDCGISEVDKAKIAQSVPDRSDVTLKFLDLPKNSLATDFGVMWAKVDMIRVLPVERVLYVDADVLVRGNLKEIWDFDLKGGVIGAVRDVGFPDGYDGMENPYFNAGVLLMDLAKVRQTIDELEVLGRRMRYARFADQDAFNVHFVGWVPLGLQWNAQGLGTYATLPSLARQTLDLKLMENPQIVHFTGPVNPGMAEILNPYIQPYTAKPWGYAGAPGHPYSTDWWGMLAKTAWKGLKDSDEYESLCGIKREAAIQLGVAAFGEKVREGRDL